MADQRVSYFRHEIHREPEQRTAPLWAFLFDIPYLAPCNVFPPPHLLNDRLMTGGGDGGMGPGASWTPFTLTQREYDDVLAKVLKPDRKALKSFARYATQSFVVDAEFDGFTDYFEWMEAVCRKHRRGPR